MSLAAILADLATIVATVSNTGNVYTRRRFDLEPDLLDTAYSVADATYARGYKIQMTMIDRESSFGQYYTQQEYQIDHTIILTVMHEAYDALDTRTTFRGVVETLSNELRKTTETDEILLLTWQGVRRDVEATLESVGLPVHIAEIVVIAREHDLIAT